MPPTLDPWSEPEPAVGVAAAVSCKMGKGGIHCQKTFGQSFSENNKTSNSAPPSPPTHRDGWLRYFNSSLSTFQINICTISYWRSSDWRQHNVAVKWKLNCKVTGAEVKRESNYFRCICDHNVKHVTESAGKQRCADMQPSRWTVWIPWCSSTSSSIWWSTSWVAHVLIKVVWIFCYQQLLWFALEFARPPLKQGQHGLIAPNESTLFPSQNVNICWILITFLETFPTSKTSSHHI